MTSLTTGSLRLVELLQALVQGYIYFLPSILLAYVWAAAIPHEIGVGVMLILNNALYLVGAGRALGRLPEAMGTILMDRMLVYVLAMVVVLVLGAIGCGMLFVTGYAVGFGLVGGRAAGMITGTVGLALPLACLTLRLWPAYALPVVYHRSMAWLTQMWLFSMVHIAWRLTKTSQSLRLYGLPALVAFVLMAAALALFTTASGAANRSLVQTVSYWLVPTLGLPFFHLVVVDRTSRLLHHGVATAQGQQRAGRGHERTDLRSGRSWNSWDGDEATLA